MKYVYPRLPLPQAVSMLLERSPLTAQELLSRSDTQHHQSEWYPTAAKRVPQEHLRELQARMREIAGEFGYPDLPNRRSSQHIGFDRAVTAEIIAAMDIVPADAAHEGVWSFLSLVLLPDVALWRYPNTSGRGDYERIIGRPRNVFRRLWWRAFALGPETSSRLHEDEAVGIMERPSLGGNPRIARTLAEEHLAVLAEKPMLPRTELMRQVTKRLRRLSVIVTLGVLDDDDLRELVGQLFAESIGALSDSRDTT